MSRFPRESEQRMPYNGISNALNQIDAMYTKSTEDFYDIVVKHWRKILKNPPDEETKELLDCPHPIFNNEKIGDLARSAVARIDLPQDKRFISVILVDNPDMPSAACFTFANKDKNGEKVFGVAIISNPDLPKTRFWIYKNNPPFEIIKETIIALADAEVSLKEIQENNLRYISQSEFDEHFN